MSIDLQTSFSSGCDVIKVRFSLDSIFDTGPHGNGFVTATKSGTTNKFLVAATKNYDAATKRFVDRNKHFVVVTKYFCYSYFNKWFCWYNKTFYTVISWEAGHSRT